MRLLLLLIFVVSISLSARAQEQTGRVTENKTQVILPGVFITNLSSHMQVTSDIKGEFHISAKAGDLLLFKSFNYRPDTVLVTDLKYKEVFMTPVTHELNEVKVNAFGKVNPQATKLPFDRDFHGQSMQYQPDPKYPGYYKGGVQFRLWTNKREERDRQQLSDIAHRDSVSAEIASVFTNLNISRYVPLRGRELEGFVIRYTPNIATFKSPAFHLPDYLSKSYAEFMKLPPAERQRTDVLH